MNSVSLLLRLDIDTYIPVVKATNQRKGLVRRVENMKRETKSSVRAGKILGEEFCATRGVRQGCPLSSMLFNILIADLEEKMERGGWE